MDSRTLSALDHAVKKHATMRAAITRCHTKQATRVHSAQTAPTRAAARNGCDGMCTHNTDVREEDRSFWGHLEDVDITQLETPHRWPHEHLETNPTGTHGDRHP